VVVPKLRGLGQANPCVRDDPSIIYEMETPECRAWAMAHTPPFTASYTYGGGTRQVTYGPAPGPSWLQQNGPLIALGIGGVLLFSALK
jgi:hypothetical protein